MRAAESHDMLKISIITAVFNRVQTIRRAVESVNGQSYAAIEHVIQDGGSTDGTLETLHEVHSANVCFVSEPDDGIYDALNRAIARASGGVIGMLHSDDIFADENVVSDIAERFKDPETEAVYGDLQYVSRTDLGHVIRHWRSGQFRPKRLKWGWMPPHPTLFLRRSVFQRFGVYDTSYRIAADYDAILRYLGYGCVKTAYIPRVLVKMRMGGESNGSIAQILRKSAEDYRAIRSNHVGGFPTLAMKNLRKISQFF